MIEVIPYGKQFISDEDINAVIETLKGDFLTQGPKIPEFESAFAAYTGSKYAVAVTNGTAALHLCALAMNILPGDKVITTPITFSASANCVKYCGGDVLFADIDPATYLIDIDKVRQLLERDETRSIKGIIPVDFAGRAVDLQAFKELADEYKVWIIEDACHAPGGFFTSGNGEQEFCGNGKYADLAIFSFHPVKHIATGEGGMITTNDKILYEKLLVLRTHGITRDSAKFRNSIAMAGGDTNTEQYPGWYMEMQSLGYNYRLTDFQAALGLSQLKRAGSRLARRRAIAQKYFDAFKDANWMRGQSGFVEGHAYHLYVVEVDNRLGLYNFLRTENIFTQVHYIPVHLMPFYHAEAPLSGALTIAEDYYKHCLSLPMYPELTSAEQDYVIDKIFQFYQQ